MPLTKAQKKFCREYVIDFNAKQAAVRAGYKSKTAAAQASRLLNNVNIKSYVKELTDIQREKEGDLAQRVVDEFKKIAFSSISHLHNTWIDRVEFEELKDKNPDILDCIQEITTQVRTICKGDGELEDHEFVKLKLYDKQRALENLGKHLGIYEKDNTQKNISIHFDSEDEGL